MKHLSFILGVAAIASATALSQQTVRFDDYFLDKTLRVDYYHVGDAQEELVTLDQLYEQGTWAGNPRRTIDDLGNGRYMVKVYDVATNNLIFSRGFDSYFGEYKTSDPALKGVKRTYHESLLIPYPKRPVRFEILRRDKENIYHPLFIHKIEPEDYGIITEKPNQYDKVFRVLANGDPHEKVDLVFIAEGYTADQEEAFRRDVETFVNAVFSFEPFKGNKSKFNVSGVFRPSSDQGMDEPRQHRYKNTVVDASFNALGTDRYMLTEGNRAYRDIASAVPYDALCILVNSDRYGGGALYNTFTISTTHNALSQKVFRHEFGHGFGGLADEYYASEVAYSDFYPKGVEPMEPNITALLDPSRVKWAYQLSPGIAVPTEWGKVTYDSLRAEAGKLYKERSERLQDLEKSGASKEEIEKVRKEFDKLSADLRKKVVTYTLEHPLKDKVGVFEGAGFASQGLYRPMVNCLMFSNDQDEYCRVCQRGLARVIDFFAK
jgi:hypothetical protein